MSSRPSVLPAFLARAIQVVSFADRCSSYPRNLQVQRRIGTILRSHRFDLAPGPCPALMLAVFVTTLLKSASKNSGMALAM